VFASVLPISLAEVASGSFFHYLMKKEELTLASDLNAMAACSALPGSSVRLANLGERKEKL
jgi:hypothetical protein